MSSPLSPDGETASPPPVIPAAPTMCKRPRDDRDETPAANRLLDEVAACVERDYDADEKATASAQPPPAKKSRSERRALIVAKQQEKNRTKFVQNRKKQTDVYRQQRLTKQWQKRLGTTVVCGSGVSGVSTPASSRPLNADAAVAADTFLSALQHPVEAASATPAKRTRAEKVAAKREKKRIKRERLLLKKTGGVAPRPAATKSSLAPIVRLPSAPPGPNRYIEAACDAVACFADVPSHHDGNPLWHIPLPRVPEDGAWKITPTHMHLLHDAYTKYAGLAWLAGGNQCAVPYLASDSRRRTYADDVRETEEEIERRYPREIHRLEGRDREWHHGFHCGMAAALHLACRLPLASDTSVTAVERGLSPSSLPAEEANELARIERAVDRFPDIPQ